MRSLTSRISRDAIGLLSLRLRARPSELKRARASVAEAAERFGLDAKAAYEFTYAVNEAVTNAMKHGRPNTEGTIGLSVDADGDTLVATIVDSGPFIPREAPDDLLSESGRGFAFMSALVDDLELVTEPGETVVRLRKRRTPASGGDDA